VHWLDDRADQVSVRYPFERRQARVVLIRREVTASSAAVKAGSRADFFAEQKIVFARKNQSGMFSASARRGSKSLKLLNNAPPEVIDANRDRNAPEGARWGCLRLSASGP
jgi:hypothetical protein